MADVRYRARSPVNAMVPLHQLLVDHMTTQGGEVRMAPRDDPVHLRFGVPAPRLEVLDQPPQHRLRFLRWTGITVKRP